MRVDSQVADLAKVGKILKVETFWDRMLLSTSNNLDSVETSTSEILSRANRLNGKCQKIDCRRRGGMYDEVLGIWGVSSLDLTSLMCCIKTLKHARRAES